MMSTTTAKDAFDVLTPDSGVNEDFEVIDNQHKLRADWTAELEKTEDEILTLRQVLSAKVKHAQELKRKLGVTVWSEFSEDLTTSLKSVRESETSHLVMRRLGCVQKAGGVLSEFHGAVSSAPLYQKTAGAMSAVTEKTGALFGGIGAKFGQLKETNTFKSFEERVGSVYTTAKSKMTGSQSNSTQDFEDALREAEAEKINAEGTVAAPVVDAAPPVGS